MDLHSIMKKNIVMESEHDFDVLEARLGEHPVREVPF